MTPEAVFTAMPCLETERLLLRPLAPGDAEGLFRIFSDEVVTRFYNWETFTDLEQARALLARTLEQRERHEALRWGLTQKGQEGVIGTCGFTRWNRESVWAMVGYDLAQSFWGQGLITEALRSVLHFGFEEMLVRRIEATIIAGNLASIRVLQKLGFQQEGVLRERGFWKGVPKDVLMFSLLAREAAALRQ
jgi:RimJ/RimL family protein N-acetyltransferase